MTLTFNIHRSRDGYFMAWTPTSPHRVAIAPDGSNGYEAWSDYMPSEEDCKTQVKERFIALLGDDLSFAFNRKQLACVIVW